MNPKQLDQLTQGLIESYELYPTRADQGEPLPSFEAIVSIIEEVRRLLFPGFYAEEHLPKVGREYRVGHWLTRLHQALTRVLSLALSHERSVRNHNHQVDSCNQSDGEKTKKSSRAAKVESLVNSNDLCAEADRLASQLLASLPDLRRQLILDAQAALEGDPAASSLEEIILTYPGFEAIMTHRFAHLLYLEGIPYLPRALSEYSHNRTGIDLHPGARIGASFFIDHGTGVVIGESTRIGNRVKIYQGVTLGALSVKRSLSGHKRHPTIEDDVVIYAGATVLGGQTIIGAGSMIGGNVWITSSIPPQSKVIGTPPSFQMKGGDPQTHQSKLKSSLTLKPT